MSLPIAETAAANLEALGANPYPGDGIVMGLNELGDTALQVYWRLEGEEEPLASAAKMRIIDDSHLIANGNHADGIVAGMFEGQSFAQAFKDAVEGQGELSTPRIAGILTPYEDYETDGLAGYKFSIARNGDPCRIYLADTLTDADSGTGHCANTYLGEGTLPSFARRPYDVMPLGEGVDDTAEMYRASLDADNRLAIAVKGINLATKAVDYRIINSREELELAQRV